MSEFNPKNPGKASFVNRVTLSTETASRLDQWASQLESFCPGIALKRQHLVEWLISTKESQLSNSDLKALKEQFYDDIELATWALQQLKAAKARNEKLSLADLLKGGKAKNPEEAPKGAKKKKSPPTSENEAPQIEVPLSGLDDRS